MFRHNTAGVREAIEVRGATLPKYSPDLNPVEMSVSKLKVDGGFFRRKA
jgi:transposase